MLIYPKGKDELTYLMGSSMEKLHFENKWLKVFDETVSRDGKTLNYTMVRPRDFVMVVAFDKEGKLIMVRQYRHGLRRVALGFVAGYIEPNENPAQTAYRELREETGYAPEKLKCVATLSQDPVRGRNVFHVFIAENCEKKMLTDNPDREEKLEVRLLEIDELKTKDVLDDIGASTMLAAIPYIYLYLTDNVKTDR